MALQRDAILDQTLALLRLALTKLKSAHPQTGSSALIAQLAQLQAVAKDVIDECSTKERDVFFAEKQALETIVAAQVQKINKYEVDLDDRRESCKLLKVDLSSQKAECERLVADADLQKRLLQEHIQTSGEQIAKLLEENQKTQTIMEASLAQIPLLEAQLAEERQRINSSGKEIAFLEKEVTEEKEKLLCVACLDKPRDTLIMPCLHFHYCFACLMEHKSANSSTCPTCRGTIQGLCMSSFLT